MCDNNTNKYIILVEGKADQKFINDFIRMHYKQDFSKNIIDNNGKNFGINNINQINNYTDNGYKLIVIFDCDDNFDDSIKNITDSLNDNDNKLINNKDIFLFPNNKDNGNLETLLINIAVRKEIMNCLNEYDKCIRKLENTNFPIDKTKVYAYVSSIKGSENHAKEEKRNYTNADVWDISHDYLDPLKTFLDKYFK